MPKRHQYVDLLASLPALPVTPFGLFKPRDKVEEKLVQAIGAVRGIWTRGADNAPYIQRAGKTLAENMESLLQHGPMAASNSAFNSRVMNPDSLWVPSRPSGPTVTPRRA